ncbi:MAG: hypothetical protein ACRBB2_01460 [Nitrosopumilus sp.]
MNKLILFSGVLVLAVLFSFSTNLALAHPHIGTILVENHSHKPQTEIIPINGLIGLEKSIISFHSPNDNTLPWGFVEGTVENPVDGYPVIIQIFKNNDPVHFAQADVDQNGKYEYKFRVLNSANDETTKLFEGNYLVRIFKVVYLDQNNLI